MSAASPRAAFRSGLRARLFQGASAVAFVAAVGASDVQAQSIANLRAAANIATTAAAANPAPRPGNRPTAVPGMSSAQVRGLMYQARVQAGVDLATQAQQAARASAQALNPGIPNGLRPGGLQPVANPLKSEDDPTGLQTWDGAELPTETTTANGVEVTIQQTEQRAILSWETFNVGSDTTLVFDQSLNGVDQADWVALNRVVGQLDPMTGLRDPNAVPAPSQIFGSIKAPGTVLILNQNGILFGGSSQVNVRGLVGTSLEVGRAFDLTQQKRLTIKDRNEEFLTFGLLAYADQAAPNDQAEAFTFSAQAVDNVTDDPLLEGKVEVAAGARIEADDGGFILLTGPKVVNAGHLKADDGQVSLQSGRRIRLQRSEGRADSVNPNVRGFVVTSDNRENAAGNYVVNAEGGLIEAARGYISLGASDNGAVIHQGVLSSTTSVARNGYVQLSGGDIQLAPDSTIAIKPDEGQETIPQDPTSVGAFKTSGVDIGDASSNVEIGAGAMVYAPSGNITIGADGGEGFELGSSRIFIDSGATITAAGMMDVLIPALRNNILIRPVKKNELRDSPDFRDGFLNGAFVYVDPRLSGVREDGVAWVGSPLIEAESYYQQVGVKASELMTRGGNITLGVATSPGSAISGSSVVVKSGAVLDVSGGWVRYEAGMIQSTKLINAHGQVVDIADADPNDTYIGIYNGSTHTQSRWGLSETWANPLLFGIHSEGSYTEGRDAGTVTIKAPTIALDGTIRAQSFPGAKQLRDAQVGTGRSGVFGDLRRTQAAASQLPTSGMLFIQAMGRMGETGFAGGGDIRIVDEDQAEDLPADLAYGQSVSIDADGNLVRQTPDPNHGVLPISRTGTIFLSDQALSEMGLGQLSLWTSGEIFVAGGTEVNIAAGGVFDGVAGRRITVNGKVEAASGSISLETVNVGIGSIFKPDVAALGSFDIVVNGTLSTRGRWVNDYGAAPDQVLGSAYTDGGQISLISAARITDGPQSGSLDDTQNGTVPAQVTDISGSILIRQDAVIDVSGGGRVGIDGDLDLSARGGDLALINQTNYFQLSQDTTGDPATLTGFRTTAFVPSGVVRLPINPGEINARISIDGTILAHGFSGGGTFTLTTPAFNFGNGRASVGTELALDFFSKTGFATYDITSYGTKFFENTFDNGLGGFNAVLATQTLTIGEGQTLSLSQSMFSSQLDQAQAGALRAMGSGGDLYAVMDPGLAPDAWDRRAVDLNLGGLLELHVEKGGTIINEAGGTLTVAKLFNEGVIRMPGGTIRQSVVLPQIYGSASTLGITRLSDAFSINEDGTISEAGLSVAVPTLTNAQLAANRPIYLLGELGADEGIRLADSSVTDLSGVAIVNPRAQVFERGQLRPARDGIVVDGGRIETLPTQQMSGPLFRDAFGTGVFSTLAPSGVRLAADFNAEDGSKLDLSGASDSFFRLTQNGTFGPTEVWSDGGSLVMGNGGTITGASIKARGGADEALGGTLTILDPTLYQEDPDAPTSNAISAAMIEKAGFDTFQALGSITSVGDVTLELDRGFFLTSRPVFDLGSLGSAAFRDGLAPVIRSGGRLEIIAPYIRFGSAVQSLSTPYVGTPGENTAIFRADFLDVQGAVLFDQSVGQVTFDVAGDVRLLGVQPWQLVFGTGDQTVANSLQGQMLVNGDLNITAGQVYPTTGTDFAIMSSALDGVITFDRSTADTPAAPYSAGGELLVQAANIVQGGRIRVPLGKLTLGSNTAVTTGSVENENLVLFAPATQSTQVLAGSLTSVSAEGLKIPYGTTTDQIEWFFAPTGADELTAPPSGVLDIGGASVALDSGARIDLSGGGDVYAYEFVSGTGGSRDVLDRFNVDPFSGNDGLQFPDGRQVYAIVPGLSDNDIAAFDPIYSADYADLYSTGEAGKRVFLSGAPGLPAGWYTLLPAKYALLPGGFRVVEQTGAPTAPPNAGGVLGDGTIRVTGYYGTGASRDSDVRVFDVQTQSVIRKNSNIALTFGNEKFRTDAVRDGKAPPRLPVDAGRLVLNPLESLTIDAMLSTTPGEGGRGAQADISGSGFRIVSELPSTPTGDGLITLTADSLTNLNAASLLVGGVRTDNEDGTTTLDITASNIVVANDADHPLSGPEILLGVEGLGATLTLSDGATIVAEGSSGDARDGVYIIDSNDVDFDTAGVLVRVANGPERLVQRGELDGASVFSSPLTIGDVRLAGRSVLLNSSGNFSLSAEARIETEMLALGAGRITFTKGPVINVPGLVISPELQGLIASVDHLTLQSPGSIDFAGGDYVFGDVRFDAPGLGLFDGDQVNIQTGELALSNTTGVNGAACGADGAPVCGTGQLFISSQEVAFGSGTLRTYGFGGGVTLTAAKGMFVEGDGGLDVGPAALALNTPFLGDRAVPLLPGQAAKLGSLTLTSTGAVRIDSPYGELEEEVAGAPGAKITIEGQSVVISGTRVRATAGTLEIKSQTGLVVADGAVLETPGFAKQFGDSADPYFASAPGGLLKLTALTGDIDLGAGSLVSVGGGRGRAGTMQFAAPDGTVIFGGTLDAAAPGGGGSFLLDIGRAFDLDAFSGGMATNFSGMIGIRTGEGNLDLTQGHTLKAESVALIAEGGLVQVGGVIDVSGPQGGDVSLFGADGVTLTSTAVIDAHADGLGTKATRQAKGGDVEIGTDGEGIITVQAGAVIDVSARQLGDRLVPILRNGVTYYSYVPADVGGRVHFRAPIVERDGPDTVRVTYAGQITGAREVVLEGFKRFDLGEIAADGDYTGVVLNPEGQIELDLAASEAGKLNWLADYGDGTLVQFVQDFDISGSYSDLGGLADSDVFHARPGMDLNFGGDIVLTSNWNLGAGVVDIEGAVAKGYMAEIPSIPGKYYILPGREDEVFAEFTSMTYRTDGEVTGEPGVLTIRAGGDLEIDGSITDGFFQFRDQTDPDYLNLALGGGSPTYDPSLRPFCTGGCDFVGDWQLTDVTPGAFVNITFFGTLQGVLVNPAPYSAAANSPAALGSLPDGAGDPLGSAELFPLIEVGGQTQHVDSWSYRLTAGSALGSVDPLRIDAAADGDVVVAGRKSYTYAATRGGQASFTDDFLILAGATFAQPGQWLENFLAANPGLDANDFTFINFRLAPGSPANPARQYLGDRVEEYFTDAIPHQFVFGADPESPTGVYTTLEQAATFMEWLFRPPEPGQPNHAEVIAGFYEPIPPTPITRPTTAHTATLVRSGTGSIDMSAGGDIDLRNGDLAYRNLAGADATPETGGLQLGGAAVYTAGHRADLTPRTIVDSLTGRTMELNAGPYAVSANVFQIPLSSGYRYGAGGDPSTAGVGYTAVLMANGMYAEGGGDISLEADRDVLGRVNVWQSQRINRSFDLSFDDGYTWLGSGEQPWRAGEIGLVTNVRINPQLFDEGVGALGGGDISVRAGRDVSDLSIVSDTSVTTADVGSGPALTQALLTFGGGDVRVFAGRDVLGGRLDVAAGEGLVSARRDITSAGEVLALPPTGSNLVSFTNALRLRLTDSQVTLEAGRDVEIDAIAALGVFGGRSAHQRNLNALGFYGEDASVTLTAVGAVSVDNTPLLSGLTVNNDIATQGNASSGSTITAVYPGSFEAVALTGDLVIRIDRERTLAPSAVVMVPSPNGTLTLAAGGDIAPLTIAMEDGDPGLLPGYFSSFTANDEQGVVTGRTFLFPGVLPDTTEIELAQLHNATPTHLGDPVPNRIYAGGDIDGMILSTPKQTRIGAGQDIVNMMFFGQNLSDEDITRIVAGRDITATTRLVRPLIDLEIIGDGTREIFGPPLVAVEGNTFIVGGPGSVLLEAGRDAGPFLNSAATDGFAVTTGRGSRGETGRLTYGGGVISIGNEWNPFLPEQGADLYVQFGVGKGADYTGFRDFYLDPANLDELDGDLFVQVRDELGNSVPDRTRPIYAPVLVEWMQDHAAAELTAAFGTTQVDYQQAYDAFKALPELRQRIFILKNVYFNELTQTSIPDGPSYQQYSRGYRAVNALFSPELGYTENDLSGGSSGATELVETGNLDLRLATVQSSRGGDIYILGPGGRVVAGSTVRTSEQAARRAYVGGELFAGNVFFRPLPAAIEAIPLGYEGVLTLRGGSINSFTDQDFLLNQSRLFTLNGGDISMWSSNGDLNAGQGPKTSANFPPVVVRVSADLFTLEDTGGAVSGAGIAAFLPEVGVEAPDVFLIAPRGTVDAGDAGVRVAGNLFIAALQVANANNFNVGGSSFGVPAAAPVDVSAQTSASSATAAAQQAAQAASESGARDDRSVITATVTGYVGGEDEDECKKDPKSEKCRPAN